MFRVADDDRAFNDILQLPNIAWPWVGSELFQGFVADAAELLPRFASITIDEILGQHRNILLALAERGNLIFCNFLSNSKSERLGTVMSNIKVGHDTEALISG